MTREEAKQLLPIIQAWAEGKDVQAWDIDKKRWYTFKDAVLFTMPVNEYRIKPETKYRPFKDAEECWKEMQKHQPFGWIKDKEDGHYTLITCVDYEVCLNAHNDWDMSGTMDNFTFADGQPFGVKEKV